MGHEAHGREGLWLTSHGLQGQLADRRVASRGPVVVGALRVTVVRCVGTSDFLRLARGVAARVFPLAVD